MDKCRRIVVGVSDSIVVQSGHDDCYMSDVAYFLEAIIRNERRFDFELCDKYVAVFSTKNTAYFVRF